MSLTPSLNRFSLVALMAAFAVSGCSDYDSAFVYSERTTSLMPQAQDGFQSSVADAPADLSAGRPARECRPRGYRRRSIRDLERRLGCEDPGPRSDGRVQRQHLLSERGHARLFGGQPWRRRAGDSGLLGHP